MIHHYNLIAEGANPVVRDCPLDDSGEVIKGEPLTHGATTAGAHLITASVSSAANIVGVCHETITPTSTDLATGTINFAKVIINPDSIWLAQWDDDESADIDVVSSTDTATTTGSNDDDLEGSWIYINSGTGVGQLAFIGEATTTVMTLDTTTAWTTTPDSASDCLIIRKPWLHAGGVDLSAGGDELDSALTATAEILILENYIGSTKRAFAPLRPRQHHMLEGLNNDNVKFFSDIFFMDNIFFGPTTMP